MQSAESATNQQRRSDRRQRRPYSQAISDPSTETLPAQLVLHADHARPGGALDYEIVNVGQIPLMFGEATRSSGRVRPVGRRRIAACFRVWGRTLRAGDRFTLVARVPAEAKIGAYQLRKRLRPEWESVTDSALRAAVAEVDRDALQLIAEFSVAAHSSRSMSTESRRSIRPLA